MSYNILLRKKKFCTQFQISDHCAPPPGPLSPLLCFKVLVRPFFLENEFNTYHLSLLDSPLPHRDVPCHLTKPPSTYFNRYFFNGPLPVPGNKAFKCQDTSTKTIYSRRCLMLSRLMLSFG
jgi:hypothetical protein